MEAKQATTFVEMSNPYFIKGYQLGRVWYFHGQVERPIDDLFIVENIAMFCEEEMHHNIKWLSERIGFLIGMVSALHIPEVADCEAGKS